MKPRKRYVKTYKRQIPGKMNMGEEKYSKVLQLMKLAGEIQDWKFEPVKLRIGPVGSRCTYTPDFMVTALDDTIQFHEIKGRSGNKAWCEEDAKVKIKSAAEQYPFCFILCWPSVNGGWEREII